MLSLLLHKQDRDLLFWKPILFPEALLWETYCISKFPILNALLWETSKFVLNSKTNVTTQLRNYEGCKKLLGKLLSSYTQLCQVDFLLWIYRWTQLSSLAFPMTKFIEQFSIDYGTQLVCFAFTEPCNRFIKQWEHRTQNRTWQQ